MVLKDHLTIKLGKTSMKPMISLVDLEKEFLLLLDTNLRLTSSKRIQHTNSMLKAGNNGKMSRKEIHLSMVGSPCTISLLLVLFHSMTLPDMVLILLLKNADMQESR